MTQYRIYFFDVSGHIKTAKDIDCVDDASAIAFVEEHFTEHGMELWCGARRVKTIPGRSDPPDIARHG